MEVDGHVEVGDYCRFRNNVVMRTHKDGKIVFGSRSGASYNCVIESTNLVQIGDFTGIAEFTVIRDSNHMVFGTDKNWRLTPLISEPIIIGDHVFIGSRCYIMPGVTIGDGAVIGPGTVVHKDVGPYEVWLGNPARRLGHRLKSATEAQRKQFKEYAEKFGIKEDRYMDSTPPLDDADA
jgi:acetyltransferase-like isoleucine patch superfamily enzyme